MLSMGILIGTSLVLIIPEGMETLYGALEGDPSSAALAAGIALALGFIVMYTLDTLPSLVTTPEYDFLGTMQSKYAVLVKSVLSNSLTVGLLFHALVDGISLGSSFASENATFEVLFFVAVIIHKIPTSFSLSSLLAKQQLTPDHVRVHLGVFAVTTPIAALATYFILKTTTLSNDRFVLGVLFMFSAGTFLYVVNHVMAEVATVHEPPASAGSEQTLVHTDLSRAEFSVSLAGILVPLALSVLGED